MISESSRRISWCSRPTGVLLVVVRAEAVRADQLGQPVGLVRRGRAAAPAHFRQPHAHPAPRELPCRLAPGEAAADDVHIVGHRAGACARTGIASRKRMSRRALVEKRPLVFVSILAALAFYYLRWQPWPEPYLLPVKGAAVGSLAVYLWLRHSSPDARLMAWAFGAAALGDMAIELNYMIGGLLYFTYQVMALGVYLRNRRPSLTPSQKWAVAALLILTPVIIWFLPTDRTHAVNIGLYALALGAMAAGAWASMFPRYRVGAGAVLFVLADMVMFAELGPLAGSPVPRILGWPLYYLGQLLIAVGVAQTLRKRDPELKIVVSN
jgi:hypothetical protein